MKDMLIVVHEMDESQTDDITRTKKPLDLGKSAHYSICPINPEDPMMLVYAAVNANAAIFKMLCKIKPDACPSMFALRVAENLVPEVERSNLDTLAQRAGIGGEDFDDYEEGVEDPVHIVTDDYNCALSHGESAYFNRELYPSEQARVDAAIASDKEG